MRIRQIKPDFWKHEALGDVSRDARLLFIGLWAIADCEGRLDDRSKRIKAEIFPYDDISSADVDRWLDELANHAEGFIIRYQIDGKAYIAIPAFRSHQKLMGNESNGKSNRPAPMGVTKKPEVEISNHNELLGNSHTEDRRIGLTEERINGHTDSARVAVTEFSEWAQKGQDFIAGLQMPNLHNLNGVLPWLSKQFEELSTTRPNLKPEHVLECWMSACEAGANKNVSSLEWIKNSFQGKLDAFKPKIHAARPAARGKPYTERVLEAWRSGYKLRWRITGEVFSPEELTLYDTVRCKLNPEKPDGFLIPNRETAFFTEMEVIQKTEEPPFD